MDLSSRAEEEPRGLSPSAKKAGKIWRGMGALEYREWVADDVKVGKLTSFPRSVKLKPAETVVFSWITYRSRVQRDASMPRCRPTSGWPE